MARAGSHARHPHEGLHQRQTTSNQHSVRRLIPQPRVPASARRVAAGDTEDVNRAAAVHAQPLRKGRVGQRGPKERQKVLKRLPPPRANGEEPLLETIDMGQPIGSA